MSLVSKQTSAGKMAEINTSVRKRKLSREDSVIEVSDDDGGAEKSSGSGDVEIVEPDPKLRHLDTVSYQNSDSNLEIVESSSDCLELEIADDTEPSHLHNVSVPSESCNSSVVLDVDVLDTDRKFILVDTVPSQNSSCSMESSCLSEELEITELDSKAAIPSQTSESNSEFVSQSSQGSMEIMNANLRQRLLELDDEIRVLRAENEHLRSKVSSSERVSATNPSDITISFSDSENFKLHKDKLVDLFKHSLEFCVCVEESQLLIKIVRDDDIDANEWIIVDEDEVKRLPSKAHKKKKKKIKLDRQPPSDLFMLDTTPSLSTRNNLQYESKFTVSNNSNNDEKVTRSGQRPANVSNCFNCSENHNLRDCPKPKNYVKINAARQKFKSNQTKTVRYHLEDDQRFAHLQPGKISEKLQHALGLRHNQVPAHIYRMRQLGYPPGWFNEILAVQHSELVLFDFEGKDASNRKKTVQDLDPDKVVEYPGFNVPLEKGVKDECRFYGCPSYSKASSKQSMLEFVRGAQKKAQDNLEACDMDIDNPSDKEVDSVSTQKQASISTKQSSTSPTLGELESEKQKLLAELTQTGSKNSNEDVISATENDFSTDEAYQTLDITGTIEELSDTLVEEEQGAGNSATPSPTPNIVKTSSFGTPILKSLSPYCRLPKPENFSQNVCDVINFENLPNATGKYEQMVGVLEKVRRALKDLSEQKS